ncbi:WD repeat-containing protein 44 [Quillaja saponaria]|uniref:WD repeat-containing protein 44 n=1 Tax=Quillaja saponaria TaxID=32244 RepID=A0AAD7LF04_QUISA|nr:WD repeat-containing protein 44 [Quillaja saponaria]KAJ7956991.1 WD repeat-containing protein 44 [Quillaja saponaria]
MLSSNGGEFDTFFDSVECLSSKESVIAKEELGSDRFGYQIWMNEPQSVKERRENFLQGMGLADIYSSNICSQETVTSVGASSKMMGLERLRACSGAVSGACTVPTRDSAAEGLVRFVEEVTCEANVMFDELERFPEDKADVASSRKVYDQSSSDQERRQREADAQEEFQNLDMGKKKMRSWWKSFVHKRKVGGGKVTSVLSNPNVDTFRIDRIKVRHNKKRWTEFSGVYIGQEIRAHKGLIWTMKFSPNGQFLASGGEDGIVRIWCVKSLAMSSNCLTDADNLSRQKEQNSCSRKNKPSHSSVVLPNKVVQIDESPLQEFHGHSGDVLDLAWSNSNLILSSSKDKTVRLWRVGCDQCLSVFRHNDYVTCIQFNPIDENYFISGSIDGKVRIWGVSEKRVVDWDDARDVITAISYQPDGKGFVVGSLAGMCRFYAASGNQIQLEVQMHIRGKKKTSGNKITGIQFSLEKSQRVMITSEDSKVRILDGTDIVHKYRGLPKSGSQMSASFTSSEKHIISIGEDSHVYLWNFSDLSIPSSKHTKSVRSCEYFFAEGATVAIPWSGMCTEERGFNSDFSQSSSRMQHYQEAAVRVRDSERLSLGNWFSIDGSCRGSMTWPEEKLPYWHVPIAEDEHYHQHYQDQQQQQEHQLYCHKNSYNHAALTETWGLAVVTAG